MGKEVIGISKRLINYLLPLVFLSVDKTEETTEVIAKVLAPKIVREKPLLL